IRAANSKKDSDRYQLKTSTTTNGKLPSIKTAVPGPKSKEIFDLEQKYIAPGRPRLRSWRRRDADRRRRQHLRRFFCGGCGRKPGACASGDGRCAVEAGGAADGRRIRDQGARGGFQSASRSRAHGAESSTSI